MNERVRQRDIERETASERDHERESQRERLSETENECESETTVEGEKESGKELSRARGGRARVRPLSGSHMGRGNAARSTCTWLVCATLPVPVVGAGAGIHSNQVPPVVLYRSIIL